jgi:hypothetical protein
MALISCSLHSELPVGQSCDAGDMAGRCGLSELARGSDAFKKKLSWRQNVLVVLVVVAVGGGMAAAVATGAGVLVWSIYGAACAVFLFASLPFLVRRALREAKSGFPGNKTPGGGTGASGKSPERPGGSEPHPASSTTESTGDDVVLGLLDALTRGVVRRPIGADRRRKGRDRGEPE